MAACCWCAGRWIRAAAGGACRRVSLTTAKTPEKRPRARSWETGLTVAVEGLIDVYYNPPGSGGASIFILYRARRTAGEPVAGDDADDARFFSLDDLPDLAFDSTRVAVKSIQ